MTITGFEFKQRHPNTKFYKLTNLEELHNGYKYSDGINIDNKTFTGNYGFYFSDLDHILYWIYYNDTKMEWIREVEISDDCVVEKLNNNYYKCNKLFLHPRVKISEKFDWNNETFCQKMLVSKQNFYSVLYINVYNDDMINYIEENIKLHLNLTFYWKHNPIINFLIKNLLVNKNFLENKKIFNLVIKNFTNITDIMMLIPEHMLTEKIIISIIKLNYLFIQHVPIHLRTDKICKLAIETSANAYKNVSDHVLEQKMRYVAIQHIPVHLQTEEIYKFAIQLDENALQFVPVHLQTEEICKIAVMADANTLQYVPVHLQTEEICKIAVMADEKTLRFVKNQTKELCMIATDRILDNDLARAHAHAHAHKQFLTTLFCDVKKNRTLNSGFSYVHEQFQTEELCLIAVKRDSNNFRYILPKFQTEEICLIAVQHNRKNFQYVLPQFQTKKICLIAVQSISIENLQYILPQYQTEEICLIAIKNNPFNIKYVSNPTYLMCKFAIEIDPHAIEHIGLYYRIIYNLDFNFFSNMALFQHNVNVLCNIV